MSGAHLTHIGSVGLPRLAAWLLLGTLLVACDRWVGVTLRNDGTEPLTVVWSTSVVKETPLRSALDPGKTAEAGYIGGPPDPWPNVIVKAFDPSGTLVYCRSFTPAQQQSSSSRNPISVKPGDVRCTQTL
jgi:hypothetical protein